jgi:hypothetical protein
MELDEHYLGCSLARMYRFMAAMSIAGVLLFFFWRGWRWGLGFALGAAASWLNFRWLKNLVDSLGEAAGKRPRYRAAIVLGLRYLLLAAAGYAILKYSEISLTAALVGLFVSVAAAILEIIYQLVIYGST